MVVPVVAGAALRGVAGGAAKGAGGVAAREAGGAAAAEAGHARALKQARQSPAARALNATRRFGHTDSSDSRNTTNENGAMHRALRRTPAGRALSALHANPFSLAKQVRLFADIPYVIAIGAAILKDVLDYAFIGSLPAIGTVLTLLISILIGLMMLLAGSFDTYRVTKRVAKRILLRYMILTGGTLSEFLFGLNFFPIETLCVIIIYLIVLADRARAAKAEQQERREQRELAQAGV